MLPLLPAFTSTPALDAVYHLDLFDLCAAMQPGSVDMILCDLPYQVHEAAWDTIIPIVPMWEAFKRVIKPRGAIVLTCVMRFAWQLIALNPDWFKYDMVGIKNSATDFLNAHNKPMRAHENILVFSDGTTANGSLNRMNYYPQMATAPRRIDRRQSQNRKGEAFGAKGRKWTGEARTHDNECLTFPTTILQMKTANIEGNLHPNQKDVDLFRYLIRTYARTGELVFDPCVGSGTTAIAAREENRRYIVGDSSAEYVEVARRRLAQPWTPSFMHLLDSA